MQDEFLISYPYLKLEFQKYKQGPEGNAIQVEKLLPDEKLLSFYRRPEQHTVDVGFDRTVSQVIKQFGEVLDLKVLLLRQSGNVWIETTLTRNWTLEQQNREGKLLSQ